MLNWKQKLGNGSFRFKRGRDSIASGNRSQRDPCLLFLSLPYIGGGDGGRSSAVHADRSFDLDSLDVVRSFDENTDPAPGLAAGFLGEEESETACRACGGNPESPGEVMVCDGCERGFHLACAAVSEIQAPCSEEWICPECTSCGVKSKRWPLGVKSKRTLDINVSPPSDADGEGAEELLGLRSFFFLPDHEKLGQAASCFPSARPQGSFFLLR